MGPLSSQQLRAMALERRLSPGDQVRQGTEGPWGPAARVKGLFGADESGGATSNSRELPVAEPLRKAEPAAPRQAQPPVVPAAAEPPTAGGADIEQFSLVTEEETPSARAAGRAGAGALNRKRRQRDALVVGSLVVLVIGLAVAGVMLGLADREPGESAEVAAPAKKPAERKWTDASQTKVRLGDVSVGISSAVIGLPRLIHEASGRAARPQRACLLVGVELENSGGRLEGEYTSWGGDDLMSRKVRLTDNLGKTYLRRGFRGTRVDGQLTSAPLGLEGSVHDLLVFEPPAEGAEFLLLQLPAAAFGQAGEVCFKIPREMIELADEDPQPRETVGPVETGVPESDRGIAELEAEEKPPGQPEKDPGDDTRSIFDDYPELRGDDEGADKDFSVEDKPDDSRPAADQKGMPRENDQ